MESLTLTTVDRSSTTLLYFCPRWLFMTSKLFVAIQKTDPYTTKISKPLPTYYPFRQCFQGTNYNLFAWALAQWKIPWPSTISAEQILLLYVSQTFLPPSAHFWSFYLSLSQSTTTQHNLFKNEIPITPFLHHLTFFSSATVTSTLNAAPCLLIQAAPSPYFGRNYPGSISHRLHL